MKSKGPLDGVRVLELGTVLSAPLATMSLGDQGADVIKLETPGGDQLRQSGNRREGVRGLGTMFLNANRNKRSIMLDLKDAGDLAIARKIAAQCDIVVQNFRPGVADRIGMGYDDLRKLRPDIIYMSISGLGETGPGSRRRVYDIVVQGIAGFAGAQAGGPGGEPTTMRTTVVDKTTALVASQAATAALFARERTGQGQHIQISMLDVALSFIWPENMSASTLIGEDVIDGGDLSRVRYCYPTADGHILVGFVSDIEFAGVCGVLGCEELVTDPRFDNIGKRFANAAELNELVAARLTTQPTSHWLPLLEAADAVFAPVNWPDQITEDPIIRDGGLLEEHQHPVAGAYRQPIHPARFSGTPAGLHRHAPALDENRAEILAEFGIATEKAGNIA
jgi:crotonobetainyl-CoA:carnitine CoA-transferase CaiB-like acyl-CoA transferase